MAAGYRSTRSAPILRGWAWYLPLALLSGWPAVLAAQVSKFIILPPRMMLYAVILSTIALWLNYRWVQFSPAILLVSLVLASGGITTVHDAWIGPAAIAEQGQGYAYYAYCEFIAVLLANISGIGFGLRRRKKRLCG